MGAGLAEIIALQIIYAHLHQHFGGLAVFHELGDGLQSKSLSEIHQGFHEEPVLGIQSNILDENPVDFHHVDGQRLELAERSITGTEIVQRHRTAERLQAGDENRRASQIAVYGGFRYFNDEAGGNIRRLFKFVGNGVQPYGVLRSDNGEI